MPGLRQDPLVLAGKNESLVLVHPRVVETIASGVDRTEGFHEAGGILIGAYRGSHIEISDCTTPMTRDVRTRTGFYRTDPGHQRKALQAWKRSNSTDTFVGEWHTHPEDHPRYSMIDLLTWTALMARTIEPLVFVIGGWRGTWWGIGFRGRLQQLKEIGRDESEPLTDENP